MVAQVRWLVAVVLLAGCVSGQGNLAPSLPGERFAQVQAECEELPARGERGEALRAALQYGGLAGLYLVLRGATEGAFWGAVTGGGAADGAWIGAAAGAGLGAIIGVAAGVGKSVEEQRRYRAAVAWCVGERVTLMLETLPLDPPRTE